jgi:hypothetical protein
MGTKKKSRLVVSFADGRELVEALRPVLAQHGYAATPDIMLVEKRGDCAALRELEEGLHAHYLAPDQRNLLELISLEVELEKLRVLARSAK